MPHPFEQSSVNPQNLRKEKAKKKMAGPVGAQISRGQRLATAKTIKNRIAQKKLH
jgi:hypothetical protein